MEQTSAFFLFLKYCIGNKVDVSKFVAKMDWLQLYYFASKQAILGLCFEGVEQLGREYPSLLKENPIGQGLLMTWMGMSQQILLRNMKVNVVATNLYRQMREDGLKCCILKGQGNALMYPNPFSRTPGDIDVWVNASRDDIIAYAKRWYQKDDDMRYHHLEIMVEGVPVELHFLPCVMNNPFYNVRLQRWFKQNADLQCSNVVELPDDVGDIAVPTVAFNVIYQLCHLYHHFFDEGIGMRQMIDYYLLLLNTESTNRVAMQRELKYLGLWKFAGAVMFVLYEVLGLPKEKMICPMDQKRGKLLLSEIVEGGNFGKYFTKYGHFTNQGMVEKYILKIWRNMHFVRYYPAEALSEPVFRTWHFVWRLKNNGLRGGR